MKQATTRLLAALALCSSAGLAFAQGNPPTTTSPNPATGAGQQNPVGGPMGTTGTQVQETSPGTTPAPAAAPNTTAQAPAADPMRPARADRN